jgi:regulator of sigma E protease
LSYLPFVVILCAMIVIHEFGHFITAKLLGIAVETFSVGFGPRLFGFRIGETDYRLSAIPLGGYVKFRGENLELLQGKSEGSVDEFLSHPKWKRFLVAAAGPVFNIATAIVIPAAAILIGFQDSVYRSQQVVVGVMETGSAAEQAGLRPGDRILAVKGTRNPTWEDFSDEVSVRPDEDIPLLVERSGQTLNLTLRPRTVMMDNEPVGVVGIEPYLDNITVHQVSPNSPAERAGLRAGDKIVAVNGNPITAWTPFKRTLKESKGEELTLKVLRGDSTLELKAAPALDKEKDEYRLGFVHSNSVFVKTNSVVAALQFGWRANLRILRLTGVIFKQIFGGQRSARNALQGPIGIAQKTAETYRAGGWGDTIYLMGILSLNLGIFNLLPIPVLDGGVILLLIIEALMGLFGLTLTMNMRERFQQVGFVVIMLLMGFVIVNDLVRVGGRWLSEPPAAQQPSK